MAILAVIILLINADFRPLIFRLFFLAIDFNSSTVLVVSSTYAALGSLIRFRLRKSAMVSAIFLPRLSSQKERQCGSIGLDLFLAME